MSAQRALTDSGVSTQWTLGQLARAAGGQLLLGDPALPITGISLDSRRVNPLEAFVALRGVRFNAHRFIPEVIQRGAGCVIVSEAPQRCAIPTIVVDDTTRALGAIAARYRARFAIPVVAITGSCGKTTTKELLAHLLDEQHAVLKTHLTENNHIGLPLTLLKLDESYDIAVVELGSNHPGEIAYLAGIAKPTVAAITNIGPAHLEHFGSLMGVLDEKLSLIASLGRHGVAVVPGEQLDVVLEATRWLPTGARLMTFGSSERCDVQALEIRKRDGGWALRVRGVAGEFALQLPGSHNVENALAALACVQALGIPLDVVREPLASFRAVSMRSEVIRGSRLTIINDCYNANPLSFARALETLRDLDVKRRVVIAGEMLELGAYAASAHQAIGRLAAQCGVDVLIAVGAYAQDVAAGAEAAQPRPETALRIVLVRQLDALIEQLPALVQPGDGVLVKGSRKIKLEQVVASLTAMDQPAAAGEHADQPGDGVHVVH